MNRVTFNDNDMWVTLSAQDSEVVVGRRDSDVVVRIRTAFFNESEKELRTELQNRVKSDSLILDARYELIQVGDGLWYVNSYVCSGNEKFRYFFYQVSGKSYVVVEMMSNDVTDVMQFTDWIAEISDLISVNENDVWNTLLVHGSKVEVKTPSSFRFSNKSSEDRLLFLGENKYLVVNVANSFYDAKKTVLNALSSVDNISFDSEFSDTNVEYYRYCVENASCNSYCTYFKTIADEKELVSFFCESGECRTDVSKLLTVRGCFEHGT